MFLVFYFLSFLIGHLLLKRFLGGGQRGGWLLFFLAPGCGLVFTSVILFFNLYFFDQFSLGWSLAAHDVVLIGLIAVPVSGPKIPSGGFPEKKLFLTVLGMGLVFLIFNFLKSPHGTGLDAWAIWKLKARFMFYGEWQKIFLPELGFSHPDYPLFYPLSLCWGWLAFGRESVTVGWVIAITFTLSLTGLLMTALMRVSKVAAWIGGLLLVSTPHFIGMGASQYADIVTAYFSLAGIVLLAIGLLDRSGRHFFFSGLFLGIGTFVKNEGFLFLAVVLFLGVLSFLFREGRKNLRSWIIFSAGALPFLAVTLFFKKLAGVSNDVVTLQNLRHAVEPFTLTRLEIILQFFWQEVLKENSWVYAWIFCGLTFIFYFKNFLKSSFFIVFLAFLIVNIGYAGVYCMTPWDLQGHLANSLDRVLLHSFPIAIFLSLSVLWDELK